MSAAAQAAADKAANPYSKAEQARMLAAHRESLKAASFAMKRAVDAKDTKEALKHAATLLSELRTGALTPKVYYELYMEVFDSLAFLEMYFMQLQRGGMPLKELYEMVQHAGNVLVRLYLMVTAGSVYIRSAQAPAKDVLHDLLDMCRGEQHPQRGLFLRYYLAQKCKDKLPDTGTVYDGAGGDVHNAIDFLVTNFGEMNRLWVRMQNQGMGRSKKRRERERQELRILVTAPITRLSSLTGLDARVYKEDVLPRLLKEMVSCKDRIAQQFLFESLLQVFPVEYHYDTLGLLLESLGGILPDHGVVKATIIALLTRVKTEAVAGSATSDSTTAAVTSDDHRIKGLPAGLDFFGLVLTAINDLAMDPSGPFRNPSSTSSTNADTDGPMDPTPSSENLSALRNAANVASGEAIASMLEVYTSLLSFALTCYPGNIKHVDSIIGAVCAALNEIVGPVANTTSASSETTATGAPRSILARMTGEAEDKAPAVDAAGAADDLPAGGGDGDSTPTSPVRSVRAAGRVLTLNDECSKSVVAILSLAQASLGLQVLSLANYPALMAFLTFVYRRSVANKLLEAVLAAGQRVRSPEIARRLCTSLSPLLRDEPDLPPEGGDDDRSTFTTEQHNVARLIHYFGGTTDASVTSSSTSASSAEGDADVDRDTDAHFQVYLTAREFLSHGGSRRMAYTFPPLVNGCLQLARRIHARELAHVTVKTPAKRVFQVLHELCMALATTHTELALRLFLQCALGADPLGFAFDFFAKAFVLYEDIVESRVQLRALTQMITSLYASSNMEMESYENLCARCTVIAVKLLKKPDSVRSILLCARLFWRRGIRGQAEYHRPKEVLKCLQKTLKLVDECMPPAPGLLVEILDAYVGFFEKRCTSIAARQITELIACARENASAMRDGAEKDAVMAHLRNTLAHIQNAKAADERGIYAEVSLN